ncbi:DUF1097 domain-containing protein [Anaerotignum lactatifermentans]|uniref:DUF1097 domain-containing protein n=1 Tax=Anaerotignum lactatifermentans TaxID=160404 RepID=A0ABS2G9S5_9FIRM|nr:DUF1097 domain-containing protein [Anaerotignum lactatifermentans]MBM6829819.1 DUF1097 domain-containing protein [Anaerotignum lactatifermentans]MBM6878241.1 DUF1097 domain-containing protein [Anaerotignum lactatifermentans]MBM6951321.1 DUF1097 domain-containing protein [Anaerotignum lactatifermentans]
MSKKATFIWCIGLGLLDGLYCILCSHLPHIQNYMWIGFISLPIYFCGGAVLKELPRYFCCAASGVLWGALTLVVLGMGLFANSDVNMLIVVTVIVCICCFVHLGLLTEDKAGGLFCNCPMVFGGFAAIFSQGTAELPWVIATLTMGLVLGWIMGAIAAPIGKMVDGAK